jgi:hypothetical protein
MAMTLAKLIENTRPDEVIIKDIVETDSMDMYKQIFTKKAYNELVERVNEYKLKTNLEKLKI